MLPGVLHAIGRLYDFYLRIRYINVDADALLFAVFRPRRFRRVQPVLVVVMQEGVRVLQLDRQRPLRELVGIVRGQALQTGPLLQGNSVLQGVGVLRQRRVGDPGEEKGGPPGVIVLVDEDLGGDGEVAGVVEDVGVLPDHGRGVDADVVLAEEDLVVLVGDVLLRFHFGAQDVRGSPTNYVSQGHVSTETTKKKLVNVLFSFRNTGW